MFKKVLQTFQDVVYFYIDGFKAMTIGKVLWLVIILKLIVLFFILRLFFFQPYLKEYSDTEKPQKVGQEFVNRSH